MRNKLIEEEFSQPPGTWLAFNFNGAAYLDLCLSIQTHERRIILEQLQFSVILTPMNSLAENEPS